VFEITGVGLVVPITFAGTPGKANCFGQSVTALGSQFGGLNAATAAPGFSGVGALLDNSLESGHAATHRFFNPTEQDLDILLNFSEGILAAIYIHPDQAEFLSKRVPRVCRQGLAKRRQPSVADLTKDSQGGSVVR